MMRGRRWLRLRRTLGCGLKLRLRGRLVIRLGLKFATIGFET